MPDWLPDFLNSNLLYGPFYQISSAIWNIVMTVCTGIMTTTPQGFSVDTWEYVQTELYPWALAIGVMSMDLFIMIGFFRAVGNFKENMTLELMIEVFIKIVILNVLMVSGLRIIKTLFKAASAMAGMAVMVEPPAFLQTM